MIQPHLLSLPATMPAPGVKRGIVLEFESGDEYLFQRAAIKGGRVLLTPVLANGSTLEPSPWRVMRLRASSNLRANILSRKEFRVGVLDSRVTTIRATLLP